MFDSCYYISQGKTPEEHLNNCRKVLDAGGKLLQLRVKNCSEKEIHTCALEFKKMCDSYEAVAVINDHVKVATECGIMHVHLGLEDMPVNEALKINPHFSIGGTANTIQDIKQRISENVQIIGAGPFRETSTKEKLSPFIGSEHYIRYKREIENSGKNIFLYAIGGILESDLETLAESGIHGVAVSTLLTEGNEQKKTIEKIHKIFNYVADREIQI